MSNVYNQQLSQALVAVDTSLEQSELAESNTVQSAKLGLYHAHGLTSKTENKLSADHQKSSNAAQQSKVVSIGVTATHNIVTASNAAVLDASNATSAASATAASIQKAATALTNLSGNVATTMAVATSLDNGSKIQVLVDKANRATKEAARLAEEASLIALDLTIEASQSRAANVVTQSGTVKGNMVALQKSISDTFGKLQDQIAGDMTEVGNAISTESEQAGAYQTARAEDRALLSSAAFINQYINHNLQCEIPNWESGQPVGAGPEGDQFKLSFDAYTEKEGDLPIIKEYRIIIVNEDDAAGFNTEAAKSTPRENYTSLTPNGSPSYEKQYITADYVSLNASKMITLGTRAAIDNNGKPLVRGVLYTFFVYVVYTQEYQTAYNNTNGLLSQRAPSFKLGTSLPMVDANNTSLIFYKNEEQDAVQIAFKMEESDMMISDDIDLDELMEFRAFIFNTEDKNAMKLNQQIDAAASTLFKLERNLRVTEQKYRKAESDYNTALAQDSGERVIEELKQKLGMSKSQYQEARKQFKRQEDHVDALNQAKISDFTIDESILETIPKAYCLAVKRNDNLPGQLKEQIDALEETRKKIESEFNENKSKLKQLNKEHEQLSRDLQKQLAEEDHDQSEERKLRKKLATLIARFKKLYNSAAVIESQNDAESIREKLSKDQAEEIEILEEISNLYKQIEKSGADLPQVNDQINSLKTEIKSKNPDIILLNARQEMLQDQLDQLPKLIKTLSQHKDALDKKDSDKTYRYYVASNVNGDFVDNYGELLRTGNSYCTVLLSAIKDSEPDAAPLYINRMSGFSPDVVFN